MDGQGCLAEKRGWTWLKYGSVEGLLRRPSEVSDATVTQILSPSPPASHVYLAATATSLYRLLSGRIS